MRLVSQFGLHRWADRVRPITRVGLLLVLLASFIALQAAAHLHDGDATHNHDCQVCQAGHLPVLQGKAVVNLGPPARPEWRVVRLVEELPAESRSLPHPSRAPPAES